LKQDTCIEVALVQDPEESGSCRKKSLVNQNHVMTIIRGFLKNRLQKRVKRIWKFYKRLDWKILEQLFIRDSWI